MPGRPRHPGNTTPPAASALSPPPCRRGPRCSRSAAAADGDGDGRPRPREREGSSGAERRRGGDAGWSCAMLRSGRPAGPRQNGRARRTGRSASRIPAPRAAAAAAMPCRARRTRMPCRLWRAHAAPPGPRLSRPGERTSTNRPPLMPHCLRTSSALSRASASPAEGGGASRLRKPLIILGARAAGRRHPGTGPGFASAHGIGLAGISLRARYPIRPDRHRGFRGRVTWVTPSGGVRGGRAWRRRAPPGGAPSPRRSLA